jgi:hypothetical protein
MSKAKVFLKDKVIMELNVRENLETIIKKIKKQK